MRSSTGHRTTVLAMALAVGMAGCGADEPEPGPDAGTAACTALLGRLPDQVLDQQRTTLDVAGAAAWGDPAIVLRCGVSPPGPTSDPCNEYDGIGWVFTETDDVYRFVTYGRIPAVEVTVPTSVDRSTVSGGLIDLAEAVGPIPKTTDCL